MPLLTSLLGVTTATGCGSSAASPTPAASAVDVSLDSATVVELSALRSDPARFEWTQFKPGVKKLILSGTADARHVAVLWYGYEGEPGSVAQHYHDKTEAIFVIDGAQSDPKGVCEKGSFYFNPPGSGHDVFDSSGLFLLAYAAPPDFARTAEIGAYENVVVSSDYDELALAPCADGSTCFEPALAAEGGLQTRFVRPNKDGAALSANVLLVLRGACSVEGKLLPADTLVVNKSTEPSTYQVTSPSGDCLLFALAFR